MSIINKEFYQLAQITPNGRIASISGEIEEPVCRVLIPQGSGGGGGMWEVRPVVDRAGHITELLFGSGADLGSADSDVDAIRELDSVISVRTAYCPRGQ